MDKLFIVVIVAAMVLCLCACASNKNNTTEAAATDPTETTPTAAVPTANSTTTEAENSSIDPALFIGNWKSNHSYLEIKEDGTGMYRMNEDEYNREFDLAWEVIDNQLVITIHYMDMDHISIFDKNEDSVSLTLVQNMLPVHVTTDDVYYKLK